MAASPRSGRAAALLLVPAAGVVAGVMLGARLLLEPPTVPRYTLAAGPGAPLHPGDVFSADLTPDAAVTGAVAARGFLVQGETVRAWDPPFVVDRSGAVHVAGKAAALFAGVPPGAWEVSIAVGRPETLPTAPRDVLRAKVTESANAAWRLVHAPVTLLVD